MPFQGITRLTPVVELQQLNQSRRMFEESLLAAPGGIFVTDVSNAARTCLMDIHSRQWDSALLERFQLSMDMLPRICSNAEVYGRISEGPLAGVPIAGALPSIGTLVLAAAPSALG